MFLESSTFNAEGIRWVARTRMFTIAAQGILPACLPSLNAQITHDPAEFRAYSAALPARCAQ